MSSLRNRNVAAHWVRPFLRSEILIPALP